MDVPNFVGSKWRARSKFRSEEEQPKDEGISARELLHRVLEVVDRFRDAREAVRLELERLSDEQPQRGST